MLCGLALAGAFAQRFGVFLAHEFDPDPGLVIAHHPAGHAADQDVLADARAHLGVHRQSAGREIEDDARNDRAVLARELRERIRWRARASSLLGWMRRLLFLQRSDLVCE